MLQSNSPRALAIKTAREILSQSPIYLDTETTGLDKKAEIIELAVVDHDGKILMDQRFRPQSPIPAEAEKIHKISNQMVANAPRWGAYWPTIRSLFYGRTICMYNADFDVRMIYQSNTIYGIRREPLKYFCVMDLYSQFRGEWDARYNRYRRFRLELAGKEAGIPIPNSHRASDDTLLTRALLHFIAASE
ncbi:MAG: 3'-5' exonuclease [Anaerolineaceae bacterium]|nr:3'-5' exonuclease [Anaerolineaceae bacterium]